MKNKWNRTTSLPAKYAKINTISMKTKIKKPYQDETKYPFSNHTEQAQGARHSHMPSFKNLEHLYRGLLQIFVTEPAIEERWVDSACPLHFVFSHSSAAMKNNRSWRQRVCQSAVIWEVGVYMLFLNRLTTSLVHSDIDMKKKPPSKWHVTMNPRTELPATLSLGS